MARQVGSERSIPHLRDIFGFGAAWEEREKPAEEAARSQKKKKQQQQQQRRDSARTLTDKDVKHLERHLSMKKTIRKKMMRDLQQAFVEDPEQLKAEMNVEGLGAAPEATFLDMLKGGGPPDDDGDSGHASDDGDAGYSSAKTSFWRRFTIKGRSKR